MNKKTRMKVGDLVFSNENKPLYYLVHFTGSVSTYATELYEYYTCFYFSNTNNPVFNTWNKSRLVHNTCFAPSDMIQIDETTWRYK